MAKYTPEILPPAGGYKDVTPIDYSPEAVKTLCYEALVDALHFAKTARDAKGIASLARELLDRIDGKPIQRNLNADASGGDVAKRLDAAIAREKALKAIPAQ